MDTAVKAYLHMVATAKETGRTGPAWVAAWAEHLRTMNELGRAAGVPGRTIRNARTGETTTTYSDSAVYDEVRRRACGHSSADTLHSATHTTSEGDTMPTETAAPDVDALMSDVHATIDQINALDASEEGAATRAGELGAEADAKIRQLPRKHHTTLRKAVNDARKAVAEAVVAHVSAPPSAEIVVMPEDPMVINGVPEMIKHGVSEMRKGVEAGLQLTSAGERVANVLLTIRQTITDPETGLPDLTWRLKATRNAASKVYEDVLHEIAEDDVERRASHASLIKATQNKSSDVLVSWLRGYRRDSEEDMTLLREIFPAAADACQADEELTPEQAIRALYEAKGVELPVRGRTEQMRLNRRVEKIKNTAKELETLREADGAPAEKVEELEGVLSDLKADLPPDMLDKLGEAAAEKTDAEKTAEALEKVKAALTTAGRRVKKVSGADKRKVKAEAYKIVKDFAESFDLDLSALVGSEE